MHLTQPNDSPNHIGVWIHLADVPAKSAECPTQRQVFTCQHDIIKVMGLFDWCGEGSRDGSQPTVLSHTVELQVAVGKHLKGPVLPALKKADLS